MCYWNTLLFLSQIYRKVASAIWITFFTWMTVFTWTIWKLPTSYPNVPEYFSLCSLPYIHNITEKIRKFTSLYCYYLISRPHTSFSNYLNPVLWQTDPVQIACYVWLPCPLWSLIWNHSSVFPWLSRTPHFYRLQASYFIEYLSVDGHLFLHD